MSVGAEIAMLERATGGADRSTDSALLGHAAVLIWNDVAAEGRAAFYEWHDKEHVPERMALPGFRRGRRFANAGHSPEWLTMYEAVDLAALISPEYLARLNAPTPATTNVLQYFRNTSRAVCRVVHSAGASTGGHVLAMRMDVAPETADAMCRYIRDEAFPRVIAQTGIVACHLYGADTSASYVNTAEASTRTFDVPAWVVLCEASRSDAAANARKLIETRDLAQLGVDVRSDAGVYALEICRLSSAAVQR